MRRIVCASLVLMPFIAMAKPAMKSPMSHVAFMTSAQAWATTNTAEVVVGVNATLSHQSVAAAKSVILKKLQGLVKGASWHITSFNQSTDSSGLEKLTLRAEARLSQTVTAGMSQSVQALSKSGQKFQVQNISYTPSFKEMQKTRATLRDRVYHQVNSEISRLDKTYHQKYHVSMIAFDNQSVPVHPSPIMATVFVKKSNGNASRPVGNKMTMTAKVVLSATA